MHYTLLRMAIWLTVSTNSENLKLPKTDILHSTSGPIMHYLSDRQPANQNVTFRAAIPMAADMCYLPPVGATKKIPQCNIRISEKKFYTGN